MILVMLVDDKQTFMGIAKNRKYLRTKCVPFEPGKRANILEMINELVNPKDITGIIVYVGPGPFTAIRVAVCIANALAFSLKVPLAGVKGINDSEEILIKGLEKLGQSNAPVLPFYAKAPNITKPKNK